MSQVISPLRQSRPRTLHIAQVSATFPPYYGGTGAICYHNAQGLASLGHRVTVFTAAPPHTPVGASRDGEVEVVRLAAPYRIGNAPFSPQLFGSRLADFDLVHLHYPYYFGAEAVWRNQLRGVPYVVTYHQDVRLPGARDWLARLHHHSFGRLVLQGARLIMATSLDYAAHSRLADLAPRLKQRVVEMPNGVDTERFRPRSQAAARRTLGFSGQGPLILFVGGLDSAHYFKGVAILLHALRWLGQLAGSEATRLVIVGDGDLRASYEAQAQMLGLGSRVRFAGRVADDDLALYYAAADMVALPSVTAGEAFGVVLLEAMASARAVVASNLPGVRAVVRDEVDGLLATPGDDEDLAAKLYRLITYPNYRRMMGEQGRQGALARYSWPQLWPQLVEYYERALQGGQGE
jgi:glycosyltransferase involved in cell wall biosynthesis